MGSHDQVILLDTHVLVLLTTEPARLSKRASSAIRRASRSGGIAISATTFWELASLASQGRLQVMGTAEADLNEVSSRVSVRSITAKIVALANQFPVDYSGDPCDSIIGATALAEGMILVTKAVKIRECKLLQTLW
jgi:PIN domain nuclease of toxin-antitoxin system